MGNAGLDEAQAGIKTVGETSITSDMQIYYSNGRKCKEELKSLLMRVKEVKEEV